VTRDVLLEATGSVPEAMLDAFWSYDEALLGNDVETMSRLFAPGGSTLRGDGSTVLVGHDAITSFRSGRKVIPTRRISALHIRMLGPEAGLVVAETTDGGTPTKALKRGMQTQLLQLGPGGWQITAAHVSAPSEVAPSEPTPNPALWRVLGDPLVSGAPSGPLHGLGVAVKDLYAVKGHRIGAGVPDWLREQQPAEHNSPVVQSLLDAGAHVVGIAETDEFAYSIGGINSHYGAPPNPRAPHATVGGSSNGPASAVALGQADIGLGTDTAGSIRVPASYAGLIGLRTTHGVVSMAGTVPLAPQFDVCSWLTRDVATSIAVCDVMIPAAKSRPLKATRTLSIPGLRGCAQTPVAATINAAIEALVTADVLPPLVDFEIPVQRLDTWFAAFRVVQGWQAWQERGAWVSAHPNSLGPDIAGRYAVASKISRSEAQAAEAAVDEAARYFADLLDDAIIALPATSTPAIPLSATPEQTEAVRGATLRLTFIASAAGLPAVSLPVGSVDDSWQSHPLPVGLQLVGAPGVDRGLLELAAAVEQTLL
jgi:Asp-tRNA(Asn)/Glu-tRNA(Gln) amidotransferase A subunit family amidase